MLNSATNLSSLPPSGKLAAVVDRLRSAALHPADYVHGGLQKDRYGAAEVEEVPCPLCGAARYELLCRERGVIGVVQCRDCELIYASPRLKHPEQVYCGDADEYASEGRLIFEGQAAHHRDRNYQEDLLLLRRFRPTGKLLDVGCGMGFFLRHASSGAWEVTGLEPSPSLSVLARQKFGLQVITGFLETAGLADESFDIITLTGVFSHVGDPRRFLREAWRILRPGGVVLIKVQNALFKLGRLRALQLLRRADRSIDSAQRDQERSRAPSIDSAQQGGAPSIDIFDAYEQVVHYSDRTLRRMLDESSFSPLCLHTTRPIQVPVWHQHVGAYYLYEVPFLLDWRRQLARSVLYRLARLESALRGGQVGWLAPNLITVAQKTAQG